MARNRENNFDLLRIICCIFVISLHVSSDYIEKAIYNGLNVYSFFECCFFVIPMCAVPCFFMMSGAFALSNKKNENPKYFYNKIARTTFKDYIYFAILYFIYLELSSVFRILVMNRDADIIFDAFRNLFVGAPWVHMWYLSTLFILYILTPYIIKFKNEIGENYFCKFSIAYFAIAMLSGSTSSFQLHYSISQASCYLGYYLIGYQIKRTSTKNNVHGYMLISFSIMFDFLLLLLQFNFLQKNLFICGTSSYFNIFVIISSLLFFYGFAKLNINREINTKKTYHIYLLHGGVLDVIEGFYIVTNVKVNEIILIIITIFLTYFISFAIAIIYEHICAVLDSKFNITDKFFTLKK